MLVAAGCFLAFIYFEEYNCYFFWIGSSKVQKGKLKIKVQQIKFCRSGLRDFGQVLIGKLSPIDFGLMEFNVYC
jgi:hypothetical protein